MNATQSKFGNPMGLVKGDRIIIIDSGKIYLVVSADAVHVGIRGLRDGMEFGPYRNARPGTYRKAE